MDEGCCWAQLNEDIYDSFGYLETEHFTYLPRPWRRLWIWISMIACSKTTRHLMRLLSQRRACICAAVLRVSVTQRWRHAMHPSFLLSETRYLRRDRKRSPWPARVWWSKRILSCWKVVCVSSKYGAVIIHRQGSLRCEGLIFSPLSFFNLRSANPHVRISASVCPHSRLTRILLQNYLVHNNVRPFPKSFSD